MENTEDWKIITPSTEHINDLARFTAQIAWITESKVLPDDITIPGVRTLFEQPRYGIFLVAVVDDKPVGSLNLMFEYNTQLCKKVYWIQNVYVEPEYRSKGVFKSLFNKAIEQAKQEGSPFVKLYVDRTNEKAQTVYQRLGMNDSGQLMFEKDFSFGDGSAFNVPGDLIGENFQAEMLKVETLRELSDFKSTHLIGTIDNNNLDLESLKTLSDSEAAGEVVVIRENDKIIGIVSMFSEWSDWRNKLMHWVYDVKIDEKISFEEHPRYLKIFLQLVHDALDKDSMGAFRVNFSGRKDELVEAMLEFGLEESHYYIYEIPTI